MGDISPTLRKFVCEHNRLQEEVFAQTLTERDDVRVFFIRANRACTDGRNIIIDPAFCGVAADENVLIKTAKFLGWSQTVLDSEWKALGIMTRALNIHESLHVIYSDFPCRCWSDPLCDTKNKKKTMKWICNIIEDAYIEAVGCSHYDNMEFYIKFMNVALSYQSRQVASEVFSLKDLLLQNGDVIVSKKPTRTDADRIKEYLDTMIDYLMFPWIWDEKYHDDIAEYVQKTKKLFLDGSSAESPDERYEYSQKIFKIIEDIIPDDEEELGFEELSKRVIGTDSHGDEIISPGIILRRGRSQAVNRRLFTDLKGNKIKDGTKKEQIRSIIDTLLLNQNAVGAMDEEQETVFYIPSSDTGASARHDNLQIIENHPKINTGLRKAYQNIFRKYSTSIRTYNNRFEQLLKAHTTVREEGFAYGSGINSSRLGNPRKEYWYRKLEGTSIPDLAVMLLIDGSGSMRGEKVKCATESAVILHEVLKQQGITHAVVEHRAHFTRPSIEVNILLDFDAGDNFKLNLLHMYADGDNRDGLALYWAEKYMSKMTQNEHKLIIVLSDGIPAHDADNYYPPDSVKDTADAVRSIRKRGTNIIGISIDDDGELSCYSQLTDIYPNLIACNDLSRLTGQILGVVAKLLA